LVCQNVGGQFFLFCQKLDMDAKLVCQTVVVALTKKLITFLVFFLAKGRIEKGKPGSGRGEAEQPPPAHHRGSGG
jgi:hypothetical protein